MTVAKTTSEATTTSAAASARLARPRRAVQRTSASSDRAPPGIRNFGPSHGSSASSAAPTTALPTARALAHPQRASSAAPASGAPAVSSG